MDLATCVPLCGMRLTVAISKISTCGCFKNSWVCFPSALNSSDMYTASFLNHPIGTEQYMLDRTPFLSLACWALTAAIFSVIESRKPFYHYCLGTRAALPLRSSGPVNSFPRPEGSGRRECHAFRAPQQDQSLTTLKVVEN